MNEQSGSQVGNTWMDEDTGDESLTETAARGGSLSEIGRRAAISAALQLVGRYFSSGEQPLVLQRAIARDRHTVRRSDLSDLLSGIRLRVALAAGTRLRGILAKISERATFRYQLHSVVGTGALTGQLDVNRYVSQFATRHEIPEYPILTVKRAEHTPENILATYAAQWVLRELRMAFNASKAPLDGPEHHQYKVERRELERMLRLPSLTSCIPHAARISLRHAERNLVKTVQRRIRRREIPNSTPYTELVNWISLALDGLPVAQPGDLYWSFYGDRFDSKLFELWCLDLLAREVAHQLATEVPDVRPNWRSGGPVYTWEQLAGTISLFFQRSPSGVSSAHRPQWHRVEDEHKTLGGVPDILALATRREDGAEKFVLADPKLRQRGGAPTEELYKVLGYFENFSLATEPRGAILYHTTSDQDPQVLRYQRKGSSGTLLAVSLNPAAEEKSQAALGPVATMILDLLDIPPLLGPAPRTSGDENESEHIAESRIRGRVKEFEAFASSLPPAVLDTSRRRVRTLMSEARWNFIPAGVQTMLATADHVGFSLASDADFSGPVIGICASVEAVLHKYIIEPATAHDTNLASECERATLGQTITMIEQALEPIRNPRPEHLSIIAHISRRALDSIAIAELVVPLRRMNQRYRIPAAHRSLLTEASWQAVWTTIIGPDALLARVIDALAPMSQSP